MGNKKGCVFSPAPGEESQWHKGKKINKMDSKTSNIG